MDIPVEIVALIEDEGTQSPIVILHDEKTNRVLPIWIGEPEARAIAMALNNIAVPRPLTHHLVASALAQMGGTLSKIVVDRMDQHTYYATIYVNRGQEIVKIDARPSDSIAIALNSKTPIFVAEEVMKKAGQPNPFQLPEMLKQQSGPRKIELTRDDLKRISEVLKKAQEREQAS